MEQKKNKEEFEKRFKRIKETEKCLLSTNYNFWDSIKFIFFVCCAIFIFFNILGILTGPIEDIIKMYTEDYLIILMFFSPIVLISPLMYFSEKNKNFIFENSFIDTSKKEIIKMNEVLSMTQEIMEYKGGRGKRIPIEVFKFEYLDNREPTTHNVTLYDIIASYDIFPNHFPNIKVLYNDDLTEEQRMNNLKLIEKNKINGVWKF